ncbi:hypothetical protein [Paenibacillus sp. P22]|uniref:hypothetical protein n=1 Tax=Paenibacillus sp. P22 TaxID=483908 RepID=UPI00038F6349|nr:hypothetical protein [Paenibacillus sp. P22]
MTAAEVNELLKLVAETAPNQPVTKGKVKVWMRVIGDKMSYADAEKYLFRHFESSRFAPMPADILELYRNDFDPDKIKPIELPDDMRGGA